MTRRLLRLLTALSLVLCVAACALWVWSYHGTEQIGGSSVRISGGRVYERSYGVFSGQGVVAVAAYTREEPSSDYLRWAGTLPREFDRSGWIRDAGTSPFGIRDDHAYLGFLYHEGREGTATADEHRRYLRVPYWFIAALATAPLALRLVSWLRHHVAEIGYRRHGLCSSCGYDLTGNESGICPECGNSASVCSTL